MNKINKRFSATETNIKSTLATNISKRNLSENIRIAACTTGHIAKNIAIRTCTTGHIAKNIAIRTCTTGHIAKNIANRALENIEILSIFQIIK